MPEDIASINVLAFADCFVPAPVLREALAALRPAALTVLEWGRNDEADLHHRVRRIEQLGPTAESSPEAAWDLVAQADLIVTHMAPLSGALIEKASRLSMIGVCRAGVENVDLPAARARNIRVYNVPGRNAVAVAEFTIGLILAERRNIARADRSIRLGQWQKRFRNEGQETQLSGKIVGVVGFGLIGQTVARYLGVFGVRLLVHDPWQPREAIERYGARSVSLDDLLRESDIVTLHARAAPGDPPVIGSSELLRMKPTATLINSARAALVDQQALIEALRKGQIAGAAIDVFDKEPLDRDAPLRSLDNVTLTPHLGGSTREAFHDSPRLLIERIQRDIRYQP